MVIPLPSSHSYSSELKDSIEALEYTSTLDNPFDAEVEFEADLEGRILSAIPEASSTPRLTRAKLTLRGCDQTTPPLQVKNQDDSSISKTAITMLEESSH